MRTMYLTLKKTSKTMRKLFLFISLTCFFQCSNLEDASPVKRNTFLRFYERGYNYTGRAVEVLSDGYLLAGDVQVGLNINSIITKTDTQGNIIWEKELTNASTYSLLVTEDGYLVLGARIDVDPEAEQVNDITKYKGLISKINENGEITNQYVLQNSKNLRADFIGNTLTADNSGNIFAVGTMKIPSQQTKSFTAGINPVTLDTLWYKEFSLIDRDYANAKSSFITNSGKLIWTASAKTSQQNKSYLCIPVVTPRSTFVNNNPFGSFEDRYYSGEDVKKNAVGFGVIGTYYNTQSQSSNMYFVRLDVAGNLMEGSEEFFDGAVENGPRVMDKETSATQDTGDALTTTSDGGYLLVGSMITTPEVGNGGTDLLLIRLDAFGNVIWKRIIGGTGDETVRNVRTTDNGFILCGTSTISGLSSAFLMKINKDGEIKD